MEGRKPGRGSRAGCTPGWLHEAQALHLPSLAWDPFSLEQLCPGQPSPSRAVPMEPRSWFLEQASVVNTKQEYTGQGPVTGHSRSRTASLGVAPAQHLGDPLCFTLNSWERILPSGKMLAMVWCPFSVERFP